MYSQSGEVLTCAGDIVKWWEELDNLVDIPSNQESMLDSGGAVSTIAADIMAVQE